MKAGLVICGPDVDYGPLALLSGSFEEKIKKATELGYHGIELMVRDPANLDWARIKDTLESAALEVPQVVTGELFGTDGLSLVVGNAELRRRAEYRVKSVIDLCAYLGAMMNIGRLRGRLDFLGDVPNSWEMALSYLRPIFEYAAEKGVRIALEPLNRYETDFIYNSAEGIRLINELGYDNIGLMLDIFHMNIEEPSMEEGFLTAGNRLWHIHIADSNRCYPGSGHINFQPIFKTLRHMNYQGYISAELLPYPDRDIAASNTINFLKKHLT